MKMALRLGVVGPAPPPSGGMATQTRQLVELMKHEGIEVEFVQTNQAYSPAFISHVKGIRAIFRLFPFLFSVWKLVKTVDVIHLMANSGWSWQLFSAPVLWLAYFKKTPVIVNYRGGYAKNYFEKSFRWVQPSLKKATKVVVPSGFLEKVFADFGVKTEVIPNIINLEKFKSRNKTSKPGQFSLVITRNLESIYGIETAINAVSLARKRIPGVHLSIAGSGPQKQLLEALVAKLCISENITFVGRLGVEQIIDLYQAADAMINPTTVDNMPNSVLEAMACGVPVVTTGVGGIPYIVQHDHTAVIFAAGDAKELAEQIERLYESPQIRSKLIQNGLDEIKKYAWPNVKNQWLDIYQEVKVEA